MSEVALNSKTVKQVVVPIAFGLAMAFVSAFIFLGIAGGGHGWLSPWFCSLTGFLMNPLGFLVYANRKSNGRLVPIALVCLGLLFNFLLYQWTRSEGFQYFHAVGLGAYVWIATWIPWQAAAVVAAFQANPRRSKNGADNA